MPCVIVSVALLGGLLLGDRRRASMENAHVGVVLVDQMCECERVECVMRARQARASVRDCVCVFVTPRATDCM